MRTLLVEIENEELAENKEDEIKAARTAQKQSIKELQDHEDTMKTLKERIALALRENSRPITIEHKLKTRKNDIEFIHKLFGKIPADNSKHFVKTSTEEGDIINNSLNMSEMKLFNKLQKEFMGLVRLEVKCYYSTWSNWMRERFEGWVSETKLIITIE